MNAVEAGTSRNAQSFRHLLRTTLPAETSLHGAFPDPRQVYLPNSHVKAIAPNAVVVSGMRGAGKSFWWAALQMPEVRSMVHQLDPSAEVSEKTEVKVGFGEKPQPQEYPDREMLKDMLLREPEAHLLWRTVLVHKLAPDGHELHRRSSWSDRLAWVKENAEAVGQLLAARDRELQQGQRWFIVLFDALDRAASSRDTMDGLIRGLLQLALDVRPYSRLRIKCFLRTDQIDESRVADFSDASKVLASQVELHWERPDLYGLLWQYAANADDAAAEAIRMEAEKQGVSWSPVTAGQVGVWRVASNQTVKDRQRGLFHALAGEWMGTDRRRGFPYTWIPNHLADAYGRTSPRSFLAALRVAAGDTEDRYPEHRWALHHESIKRGVQAASRIRVGELIEDHPWVDRLMRPLSGLVVPCSFEEVSSRWRQLPQPSPQEERPLPAHWGEGPDGWRRALEELGIFARMGDGRVNIPDVFRVGYGLGRRGGVKPVRRGE